MAQTNNNNAEEISKSHHNNRNNRYIKVLAFYNKHFPTDKKTYSIRFPLLGLVLSILSVHTVINFYNHESYFFERNRLIIYSYILLSVGAAYELYWGFNIGDRKQYTPWIVLKIVEIILTFIQLIIGICDNKFYLERVLGTIIFGFIILFINTYLTYTVIVKSFKIFMGYGEENMLKNRDDNIYDFPEDFRVAPDSHV